tara:strand:+ start:336 stop:746 length:411 start_codon:yes stop_codon:yes gene_type:complete
MARFNLGDYWSENKEDIGEAVGSFAGKWADALSKASAYKSATPEGSSFGGMTGMGGQIGNNAYVIQPASKEIFFQPGTPAAPSPSPWLTALQVGAPLLAKMCDERVKVDMAPLETTEVNDALAEAAFFVKGLRECA